MQSTLHWTKKEEIFIFIYFDQKSSTVSTNGYQCHMIRLRNISLDIKYPAKMALVKVYHLFHTSFPFFMFFFNTSRYDCNSMWCKVARKPSSVSRSHIQYPACRLKPARIRHEDGGDSYRFFPYFLQLFADYLLAVWCPITDSNDYMSDSRITMGTGTRDSVPMHQHSWEREDNSNPNRRIRKGVGGYIYIERGGREMWE